MVIFLFVLALPQCALSMRPETKWLKLTQKRSSHLWSPTKGRRAHLWSPAEVAGAPSVPHGDMPQAEVSENNTGVAPAGALNARAAASGRPSLDSPPARLIERSRNSDQIAKLEGAAAGAERAVYLQQQNFVQRSLDELDQYDDLWNFVERRIWGQRAVAEDLVCHRDGRGKRIGCKGQCSCRTWESCYSNSGSEPGVCEISMALMVVFSFLIVACLFTLTVLFRMVLQHIDMLSQARADTSARLSSSLLSQSMVDAIAQHRQGMMMSDAFRDRWPGMPTPPAKRGNQFPGSGGEVRGNSPQMRASSRDMQGKRVAANKSGERGTKGARSLSPTTGRGDDARQRLGDAVPIPDAVSCAVGDISAAAGDSY